MSKIALGFCTFCLALLGKSYYEKQSEESAAQKLMTERTAQRQEMAIQFKKLERLTTVGTVYAEYRLCCLETENIYDKFVAKEKPPLSYFSESRYDTAMLNYKLALSSWDAEIKSEDKAYREKYKAEVQSYWSKASEALRN